MAQLVKNPPAMQESRFDSWIGKICWRRERLPTPEFWPREFHGLYSTWGVAKSWTQLSNFHFTSCLLWRNVCLDILPIFCLGCLSGTELHELLIYFGDLSFVSCFICCYFLPFLGLSFCCNGAQSTGGCDGAQSMAKRSYPTSEVRDRSWEDPMPEGQRPSGVIPHLRSGAAAKSARLQWRRNGRKELPHVWGQERQLRGATPCPMSGQWRRVPGGNSAGTA